MNFKFLLMPIFLFTISVNAQNTTIGDVDMGKISNSEAFNQVKKLLGKWEGKLYQQSGAVVDTVYLPTFQVIFLLD